MKSPRGKSSSSPIGVSSDNGSLAIEHLAHLLERHAELLGELLGRGLAANLVEHLPAPSCARGCGWCAPGRRSRFTGITASAAPRAVTSGKGAVRCARNRPRNSWGLKKLAENPEPARSMSVTTRRAGRSVEIVDN